MRLVLVPAFVLLLSLPLAACGKSEPAAPGAPAPSVPPAATTDVAPAADAAPAPIADTSPQATPDGALADAATAPTDAAIRQGGDADPTNGAAPDAAPADTSPPGDPDKAATPEEALRFYFEGTRDKDAAKLWAVMSTSARTALEGVKNSAIKAPEAELTAVGLTREALEKMTVLEFFSTMVKATPMPADAIGTTPPSEVVVQGEGDKRKLKFKLGNAFCQGEAIVEDGAWKIEGTRCEEGG